MGLSFSEYYPEVKAHLSFEIESALYSARSPYQKIDIVESGTFGRMLLPDNMIMLTEKLANQGESPAWQCKTVCTRPPLPCPHLSGSC